MEKLQMTAKPAGKLTLFTGGSSGLGLASESENIGFMTGAELFGWRRSQI